MREAKPAGGLERAKAADGLEKASLISERPNWQLQKILIAGYPMVGKTKYAEEMFICSFVHTDDYLHIPNDEIIDAILGEIDSWQERSYYAIEGVQTVRLFRRMLQTGHCLPDLVIWLRPLHPVLPKHEAMRKAIDTVWAECLELNKSRGVNIVEEEGR